MSDGPVSGDHPAAMRTAWLHTGARRPDFAVDPGPGQESVWDYPRPPVVVADHRLVEVHAGTQLIAASRRTLRVLETASPPTFYLPPADVDTTCLRAAPGQSFCEWKGHASYFDVITPDAVIERAAWTYHAPYPAFASIRGHYAFYPARLDCRVDQERVRAQQGGFYGGWITDEIVGPFKGEPRTQGW